MVKYSILQWRVMVVLTIQVFANHLNVGLLTHLFWRLHAKTDVASGRGNFTYTCIDIHAEIFTATSTHTQARKSNAKVIQNIVGAGRVWVATMKKQGCCTASWWFTAGGFMHGPTAAPRQRPASLASGPSQAQQGRESAAHASAFKSGRGVTSAAPPAR